MVKGDQKKTEKDKEDATSASASPIIPTMDASVLVTLLAQAMAQAFAAQPTAASPGTSSPSATPPPPSSPLLPVVRSLQLPRLSSPEELTIPSFRDWKQRWVDYDKSQQLSSHPLDTQLGILRSALHQEWTMLWTSGRLTSVNTTSSPSEIIQAMEDYLRRKRNPLLDRQEFHRRDQQSGESVDRYFATLKTLDDACSHESDFKCLSCSYPCKTGCANCGIPFPLEKHLQETRIRDRLICGLRDKEMQRRVLAEQYSSVLTLEKVQGICVAFENSNAVGASLSAAPSSQSDVHATGKTKSSYKKRQSGSQQQQNQSECPAHEIKCHNCGTQGHFARVCKKKKKDDKPPAAPTQRNNAITAGSTKKLLQCETVLNGTTCYVKWEADTGSEADLLPAYIFDQLGESVTSALTKEKLNVVAANNQDLGCVGSIPATIKYNGLSWRTQIGVCSSLNSPLLSLAGCKALGLVPEEWPYHTASKQASGQVSTLAITQGKVIIPAQSPQSPSSSSSKEAILQQHAPAFDDSVLRPMNGPPISIELMEGAVPSKRFRAYNIPFHWRDSVKAQLDTMVAKGVIEPVPVGEAIDWCHPMVVVPKKGSSEPRITVDLTGLNKFVRRPAYPVRVPREVVARIPPGMLYFSTLDARHGYWQVMLDEASKKLTTFITPWGSFRFCRNVMGLISAGDEQNRRGDEALQGIDNVQKIVEDIIIYDKDLSSHIKRVKQVIARCQEHGITLNAKKFIFAQREVDWCGYHITPDGYTPAPHLYSALSNFPVPTNKTDVRSFNGLVQQFEAFSHKITEMAAPIRSLLSAKAAFVWESPHQLAFEAIINELCSSRVLAQFSLNRPLRLETDAAQSKGLGFALYQQQHDDTWRLLQVGSRFVTPAESRYSASEVEMLAVVWAVNKCRLYLLGQLFELIVDHRPLIPIINSKTLDEIDNPRLQRLKEKLASYRIHAIWRAGAKHTVVDVFSRFPVVDPSEEDIAMGLDEDPTSLVVAAISGSSDENRILTDPLFHTVREANKQCSIFRRLMNHILGGWPPKDQLDEDLSPYWALCHSLSPTEDAIFLGTRLLIPKTLRPAILKILHASHQGQERTLRRARQSVFWPGITNDIRNVVRSCQECAAFLPSQQKEPLQSDPPPTYPFQEVGVDIFSYAGYEYLVMVDRFSGWINVDKCGSSATTSSVIHILKTWMAEVGIPQKLVSDNGPQFSSVDFQNWTKKWNILHSTSSPHFPQSNGLAESAVKTAKYLLAKTSANGNLHSDAFLEGLMELRNTPRADGRSPAQLLFGAPTRTKLPLHRSRFSQEWKNKASICDERASRLREKARQRVDLSAKSLSRLEKGDVVLVQDHKSHRWTLIAEVVEVHYLGRSYLLRTESGRILRRNRRFLRRFVPDDKEISPSPDPTTPPRRSSRTRQPVLRFANSVGFVRSPNLQGGHGALSTNIVMAVTPPSNCKLAVGTGWTANPVMTANNHAFPPPGC